MYLVALNISTELNCNLLYKMYQDYFNIQFKWYLQDLSLIGGLSFPGIRAVGSTEYQNRPNMELMYDAVCSSNVVQLYTVGLRILITFLAVGKVFLKGVLIRNCLGASISIKITRNEKTLAVGPGNHDSMVISSKKLVKTGTFSSLQVAHNT